MDHRIGTGEPCLPMEEQHGWSPGQEDPSCLQWDSSRSQRTGPTGHQPLLIRGQVGVKNRWVTETDAELYGRPILTESNGLGKARQVYLYSTFHTPW